MTIMRRWGGAKIHCGEVVESHQLSVRLKRTRRIEKLTTGQLAKQLGLKRGTIARLECGRGKPLSPEKIRVVEMWVASREIGEDLGFLYGTDTQRPNRRRRIEEDHPRTDIPGIG